MRRRVWQVAALAVLAVGVAAVPASAGPDRPWMPPRPSVAVSRVVPEIVGGAVGCGDGGRTYLRVRRLVETSPGVWQAQPGGVQVQGWFNGAWRPAAALAVITEGVIVREGWYRWRPVTRTAGGTVIGPEWTMTGDLCDQRVNDLARQEGVA